MKRILSLRCNTLMRFNAHHNIRRLDADNDLVIIKSFDHTHLIHRAFYNAFRCHMSVFFNDRLFQRAAVDTDTDRHMACFCHVHDRFYPILAADISRINTYFIHTVFHSFNCQPIIKMNIAD